MDSPATVLVIEDLAALLAEAEARLEQITSELAIYRGMVSVLLTRLHQETRRVPQEPRCPS